MTRSIMGVLPRLDQVGKSIDDVGRRMQATGIQSSFLGNALASYAMQAISWTKNLVTGSLMAGARLEQLGVATRFLGEKAGYTGEFIDDLAKSI